MKKIILTAMMAIAMTTCLPSTTLAAPTKQQKKVAYTIKNLKLDATKAKALQPMLMEYLTELKKVQKPYDDLKEKYKNDIKNGVLTDKAATALLNAKWTAAKAETAVKEKYEKKFQEVISAKKIWYCFDLLNDKMSKIEGTKSSKQAEDDDED